MSVLRRTHFAGLNAAYSVLHRQSGVLVGPRLVASGLNHRKRILPVYFRFSAGIGPVTRRFVAGILPVSPPQHNRDIRHRSLPELPKRNPASGTRRSFSAPRRSNALVPPRSATATPWVAEATSAAIGPPIVNPARYRSPEAWFWSRRGDFAAKSASITLGMVVAAAPDAVPYPEPRP